MWDKGYATLASAGSIVQRAMAQVQRYLVTLVRQALSSTVRLIRSLLVVLYQPTYPHR